MWKYIKTGIAMVSDVIITIAVIYAVIHDITWAINLFGFFAFFMAVPISLLAMLIVLLNDNVVKDIDNNSIMSPRWWTLLVSLPLIFVLVVYGHFFIASAAWISGLCIYIGKSKVIYNREVLKTEENLRRVTEEDRRSWNSAIVI
jgi:hypothetical protein